MAKRKRAAAVSLLPQPADQFIGRRAELEQLVGALQPGRVVTLVGEPGIGKRALAAAAIDRLRQGDALPQLFPAGVVTLCCSQYPNDHLLLSALARSLGGSAYPGLRESVAALLENKRLLIVLQDVDLLHGRLFQEEDYGQIVSPAGDEEAAAAAQDAAALQDQEQVLAQICALLDNGQCGILLTTSDSALARGDVIELGPLSEAEGRTLLAVYSEDVIDSLQESTRIIELLGGHPLSLVLGGYWLAGQDAPVAELREALEACDLAQLSPEERRPGGLDAVFQLCTREFDSPTRTALRLLSMLATAPLPAPMVGGIVSPLGEGNSAEPESGEMIQAALAAMQKGIGILSDLVALGLLVEQDAGLQYRHYLLLELAARREDNAAASSAQEFAALVADMIERVLSFAEMVGEEDAAFAPELATHLLHLQGALYFNRLWSYVCDVAVRGAGCFTLPSHWYALFDVTRMAYRAVRQLNESDLIGGYLLGIGLMLSRLDLAHDAAVVLAQALTAIEASGDEELALNAVQALLYTRKKAGDTAAARQSAERFLALAEQADDPPVLSRALIDLAQLLSEGADKDTHVARVGELVERALALQRQQGDQNGLLDVMLSVGVIWSTMGDTARALKYDGEALDLARRLRNRISEAAVLINLGDNYNKQDETRRALRTFEKALEVAQRARAKPLIAVSSWRLANSVEQSGSTRAVLKYYEQCLAALDPAEVRDPTPAEVQAKIAVLRSQTKA